MNIKYNKDNKFATYSEDQINDLIQNYITGKLDDALLEDFEELMYLNDDVYEKVRVAQAIVRVGRKYSDELFSDIINLDLDQKAELYRQRVAEAFKTEKCKEAQELCEEALELWPNSSEFKELLAQAVAIQQIEKSADVAHEILLKFGLETFERLTLPNTHDEEMEFDIPNPCDISFATETGEVIWKKRLSNDDLFAYDEAATRSFGGVLHAPDIEDEEPSFEEELLGGRIVVRVYKGSISGKLSILLKRST